MMLTLCAGFSSCSDDDDDNNSGGLNTSYLEGTWRHVSERGVDSQSGEYFSDGYDDGFIITKIGDNLWEAKGLYFHDDGTYVADSYYDDRFTLNGNCVMWEGGGYDTIELLTADKMELKSDVDDDGCYEIDAYVRIQ